MTKKLVLGILIFAAFQARAAQTNSLQECWNKQVKSLNGQYLAIAYQEQLNELYHSPEPWQQMHYTGTGSIWYSADAFLKQDTLVSGKRILYSKTQLSKSELLLTDYGRKTQSDVHKTLFSDKLIETARYTPVMLINYFLEQQTLPDKESSHEFSVYKAVIHKTVARLYIRNADKHLVKITTLENDDLRGDLLSTFTYSDYRLTGHADYPATIMIEKMNGRLKDEIHIVSAHHVSTAPTLLERPADYKLNEDIETKQVLKTERYNDHLYFISVLPNGSKVTVVVFNDFLLVSEAPLNSINGELIIAEARKIAPGKPIRYFTFGHHHPDYIGGMRAFIHKGATVLSVQEDKDYISYLAQAPHTLSPDSLQLQPKPLKWEVITDSTTITDGNYQVNIYHIGKKSGHTSDYLVFYFPQEKLLVEGDLVWMEKNKGIVKAGDYQAGLYHAIKDLGLEVQTIIQTWGIAYDKYETVIPFEDLEQSVHAK